MSSGKTLNFIVDKEKAFAKWKPVLEKLNINEDDRKSWIIGEYFHYPYLTPEEI